MSILKRSLWIFALLLGATALLYCAHRLRPSHSHHYSTHFTPLRPLPFSREELLAALQGDVLSTKRVLASYQQRALHIGQPFDMDRYKEALTLINTLLEDPADQSGAALPKEIEVVDSSGAIHKPRRQGVFLPQTYLAAHIMLAIAPPNRIAAIPGAMRNSPELYSNALMEQIELNTDRALSEALFLKEPEVAFVARYSNPAMLEALKNQGVTLFFLDQLDTIDDAIANIGIIAKMTGCETKGQLLQHLVVLTFQALDAELAYARSQRSLPEKALYLNYFTHLATPTASTLKGQLLERLGVDLPIPPGRMSDGWTIALDQESIIALQPDALFIASSDKKGMIKTIRALPGLQQTPALRGDQLFYIDQATQESPCQLVALAYYDLCRAYLSGRTHSS
jgi:ABC-type Fe3+-hydroxamate transport system substrate-binding protein